MAFTLNSKRSKQGSPSIEPVGRIECVNVESNHPSTLHHWLFLLSGKSIYNRSKRIRMLLQQHISFTRTHPIYLQEQVIMKGKATFGVHLRSNKHIFSSQDVAGTPRWSRVRDAIAWTYCLTTIRIWCLYKSRHQQIIASWLDIMPIALFSYKISHSNFPTVGKHRIKKGLRLAWYALNSSTWDRGK